MGVCSDIGRGLEGLTQISQEDLSMLLLPASGAGATASCILIFVHHEIHPRLAALEFFKEMQQAPFRC